jgi:hypothetical protein
MPGGENVTDEEREIAAALKAALHRDEVWGLEWNEEYVVDPICNRLALAVLCAINAAYDGEPMEHILKAMRR